MIKHYLPTAEIINERNRKWAREMQTLESAAKPDDAILAMVRELDLRQADRLLAIDDCLKSALEKLPPFTVMGADYTDARNSIEAAQQILQLYCRAQNERQRREEK